MADSRIEALAKCAQQGQKKAEEELFGLLLARFRLFVRQRIWNENEREEVVQEALAAIFREYKTMTYSSSFGAWAYRVLDNRILGYIQTKRRQGERFDKTSADGVDMNSAAASVDPGLKLRLLSCLREIGIRNMQYTRVLNFQYQGYTTAEICQKLGLTRANLYSVLSRARSLLQACLERGKR
jgi:RNA polymerase sigma factor (sigma-70 family)